ncbi:MAG: HAD family phosphatase [Chitinophagales bacterium]
MRKSDKIPKGVTTLMFDVGNVLVDLDFNLLTARFKQLAQRDFRAELNIESADSLFSRFDRGEISATQFCEALQAYLIPGTTHHEIADAWNALITGFPPAKFELLQLLREHYRVIALSNINILHLNFIDRHLQETFQHPLRDFFDHAYYSFEMGARKPEARIYDMVLQQEDCSAENIFFIDDLKANIEAAQLQGFHTFHLTDRDQLLALFEW